MPDRADGPSLRSGFLRQVSSRPDAPAVVVRGVTRSYSDLHDHATRWAAAITNEHGGRPERVGVFAYRSETAYAGTLAALCAGATFVPLNPTFPVEKTAAMVAQADLDAIIVDATCLPQLAAVLGSQSVSCVLTPETDDDPGVSARVLGRSHLRSAAPLRNLPPLTPEDTAYLLFTSGSTGAPKGVPVTHGNAVYFVDYMSKRYGIGPDDRLSQTFDQTFDLSVFDLFMAWTNGACVYAMASVDLLSPASFINKNELTVWFSVPSVPAHMRRRKTLLPNSLPTLRWSLFCGEPLPRESAEAWQNAAPNSIVENLYGPTELTIACFLHRWNSDSSPELCRNGLVPIGRPYDGLLAVLVNEELQPVAPGEPGELCVAGPQTTPGYWRAPEITSQRYVDLPVSRHEKRRFYRTGDIVASLPDSEYVFLGRADQQIKVLGHRVELGEIEAALRADASVEHAVAIGWPATAADFVVAYVSGNNVDVPALLERAKAALPAYIVPRQIHVLSAMPLNANGKVDRKVLTQRLTEQMTAHEHRTQGATVS